MLVRTSLLALLFASACSTSTPEPPPAQTPAEQTTTPAAESGAPAGKGVALIRARTAIGTLGTTLKGTLVGAMSTEGPMAALHVCNQDAGSLTATVAANTGVHVGRSSLRLRNPDNAAPAWVQAWLETQGERSAEGAEGLETSGVLADGTAVVRVVKPLAVEAPCLVCHGSDAARPAELTQTISEKYPTDQATGYDVGDLRGAIWAEAPVIDTGLHLTANGSDRWMMDESTRAAMDELRAALAGPALADMASAATLAERLSASLTKMVQGCTMDGASHDQLHHFLEVFFPTVEALKTASSMEAAKDARSRLQVQVIEYDLFFE